MPGISGWLGGSAQHRAQLDAEHRAHRYDDGRYLIGWIGREEGVDGPTLAKAYEAKGPAFLRKLEGRLTFALIDRSRREILLVLDRFGIHSLSYCPIERGVAFSTGANFPDLPDVSHKVDPQAIFNYVYFHMIPSPRGVFKGRRKLRAGEYVHHRRGELEHGVYWRPKYEAAERTSEDKLAKEFRETMKDAVRASCETAVGKVGAFLSGGTDSSTIAGHLGEVTGEPANTYSIGFDVPGYDESEYAQIAVRHFQTKHHSYVVTPRDVLEAAPKLAAAYTEPFGNASAVATYYCARLAKEDGVQTLLGGDGGDEIFAGNERYAKQKLFEYYYTIPSSVRKLFLDPLASHSTGPLRKIGSYVRQARTPLPDRLESYNFLSRIPPRDVFTAELLDTVDQEEPLNLLRECYNEAPTDNVLHRLLYMDLKFTLADNDLRKVGRTCELVGIDARYPFLEPNLVDFANRVPPELKLKGQKLRYFFKRASEGFLPREILTKPKHGFGVPCGRWMRDDPALRELAYDSLSSLERRGYVSKAFIERLRKLHQGEHVDYYGVMVWVLTMLELWHQHHAP
ncbi:MAG: asparagine synthase [Acidobacteria bacterium]|nr:MAG: asparagine synthase [Acidobacteriota bacterium]